MSLGPKEDWEDPMKEPQNLELAQKVATELFFEMMKCPGTSEQLQYFVGVFAAMMVRVRLVEEDVRDLKNKLK